jgi:SAM-dependent methyltransferase
VSEQLHVGENEKRGRQVEARHYEFSAYIDQARWASIWHQVDELLRCRAESVLEVGKGSGVLGALLRHFGIRYTSVDLDADLRPDCVGSVTSLPFTTGAFDAVCCFQVLEHLPFKSFPEALSELARVTRGSVLISLPDAWPTLEFLFRWSNFSLRRIRVSRPRLRAPRHEFDGEHYWEISKRGYPLNRVLDVMAAAGLRVDRNYRVIANPYHRFFVTYKMAQKRAAQAIDDEFCE